MDNLITLIKTPPPGNKASNSKDALTDVITSYGGEKNICDLITRILPHTVIDNMFVRANEKAKRAVENAQIKAGEKMDLQTRTEMMEWATRHAIGLDLMTLLKTYGEKRPNVAMNETASPFAMAAKLNLFNDNDPEPFKQLAGQNWTMLRDVLGSDTARLWSVLCGNDIARAQRTKTLLPSLPTNCMVLHTTNLAKFPAIAAVAEVVCCIPNELNLKTGGKYVQLDVTTREDAICVLTGSPAAAQFRCQLEQHGMILAYVLDENDNSSSPSSIMVSVSPHPQLTVTCTRDCLFVIVGNQTSSVMLRILSGTASLLIFWVNGT